MLALAGTKSSRLRRQLLEPQDYVSCYYRDDSLCCPWG